jgi:hypothetical protein
MKNINSLTHGSRVRVKGLPHSEISVCTLSAVAAKYGETVADHEELDRKFGRPTQYAWIMQHAGVLSADYPGKAEAHAAKWAAIAAAPEIETGDVLEIDGVRYSARVMGDYSDPVHLSKL